MAKRANGTKTQATVQSNQDAQALFLADSQVRPLFSFDLGNGFCKVRSIQDSGEYRSIYGALSRRNTLVNAADRLVIEFEGGHYVFGDDVRLLCDKIGRAHV